jgi:hypothetical protein
VRRLFLLLVLIAIPVTAPAAPTPFAAIFEISQDGAGHLTKFEVVGMVDARTNSTKPEPITFPKAYLDAARDYVEKHLKPGKATHYFTYFPYDPNDLTYLGVDSPAKQ